MKKRNQKALIYSGGHHAFVRYRQPVYDFEKKKLNSFRNTRMGNLVYARIGARAFNIRLHAPWITKESPDKMACPAGGVIDAVMAGFADKRVGFDAAGTPFGKLKDPNTYYAVGYESFKLEDICDGYIYQKPFKNYEGVTADPLFVTAKDFQEALDGVISIEARKEFTKPEDMIENFRREADIQRRLRYYNIICPIQ